jgi:hypothetical protein
MPSNKKPTPEELQRGAAELVDLVTSLLAQLNHVQGALIDAGRTVKMSWPEIGAAMGKSENAARLAHRKWLEGRP